MNHIFIDFEMNPIEKKHKEARQICTHEIIEMGAVMLDKNYEEICRKNSWSLLGYRKHGLHLSAV